jgi:glutathione S-transferase
MPNGGSFIILIGMFDSPFARRVAVSMNLLEIPFARRNWSARALIPRSGKERRETLRIMAIATGAAEKGVAQVYETVFRPTEKRHRPWTDRCNIQMRAALAALDRMATARAGSWLVGDRLSQADITVTCAYTFLVEAPAADCAAASHPGLAAIAARCEALPEFSSVKVEFFSPANG